MTNTAERISSTARPGVAAYERSKKRRVKAPAAGSRLVLKQQKASFPGLFL
jgi:hypothetical protein